MTDQPPLLSFNWRAFLTFFIAIAPAFPGYVLSCANIDKQPDSLMKLSRLGFMIGFLVPLGVYPLLNYLWPPRGLGEGEDHHDEDTFVLPSAYDQTRPTQGKYAVVEGVEEGVLSPDSDGDRAEKNGYAQERSSAAHF